MPEFRVKMGAPTPAQKAAQARRISQATIALIVKSAAHKAAREAVAATALGGARKATSPSAKIGLIDRNDAADNVRVASLDLAPVKPTEVPKEARGMSIEDGIVATLRAGRKPK